ncbi:MAG: glycerate kinase [Rhodospirillales bacterium]|nr:glycerate kinase [Rhodospirillales bacterium]
MIPTPRAVLLSLFGAAVAAADPRLCLPPYLPPAPKGRLVILGAGKASAAMARAVEDNYPGPLSGLVVTRYGHGVPCARIEMVEAAHPVPDATGRAAAARMLAMARELGPDDLALVLISGGGSALLTLPAPGIAFQDMQALTAALLKSGAAIDEINCVRKHLSQIAGGRLAAAAHPARVLTLAISDVPGDDPSAIASGPTVGDPTTLADARRVLAKYAIVPPASIGDALQRLESETPKPGDPALAGATFRMIASPRMALDAAAAAARAAGFAPLALGDAIEGEAREVARDQARLALRIAAGEDAARPPVAILSGGETTVTVRGGGRGGRNAEFLLALAVALDGAERIHALACDTDGIDGTEDNAGALAGPDTPARARTIGLDARAMLDDNDGYSFFSRLGDLVITGPTHTNVNDFRAILILPP